jgi:uncharacterized membrane protein YhaH (DUF805 family)
MINVINNGINNFINCVTKKYVKFKGRASRQEYWMYCLFYSIILIALAVVDIIFFGADFVTDQGVLNSLFWIANLCPGLAVASRRLHDTNHSAHQLWWYLTIIGSLWVLYLLVKPGDSGQNKYSEGNIINKML